MPDATTLSRKDKLQTIRNMGIDIEEDCPSDYGFFESKICLVGYNCGDCWIKSLED